MLPNNAQQILDKWIHAAGPVVEKLYGQSDAGWPEVRAHYMQGLEKIFPAIDGVSYRTVTLGNVPAMLSEPHEQAENRVVLYLHGGGYVHGGVDAYRGLTGRIAATLHARVYTPDYRQAPEFPFPTPIDDAFRAYCALLDSGIPPENLVLVGDSAGARW